MTFQIPDYVAFAMSRYSGPMPDMEITSEHRWIWPPTHTLPEFVRRRLPRLYGECTDLWRGYVCHWIITGDSLALCKVQRRTPKGWAFCDLGPIFGDMVEDCNGTKLMPWCDWFTGTMELIEVSKFQDYLSNWRSSAGGTKTYWVRGKRESSKRAALKEMFE